MSNSVKSLAGLGALVSSQSKGKRGKVQREQPERTYRTFETAEAIQSAMESALDDANVTDDTLIEAYQRVIAGGLLRQAKGEQPWTFGNQTGINRDLALRLELAGLIKTGGRNSMIARIFFTDAGNVKVVKDNGLNAVLAMLRGDKTGTDQ